MEFVHTQLAFNRPILSYSKVQRLYARFVRNRVFQARKASVLCKDLLNIGCGDRIERNFINIDYNWLPGVDVCWDVSKPLPFADASIAGIFSEHCLEHLSFDVGMRLIAEIYRVLVPGGVLRIIVPDAEIFLRAYCAHHADQYVTFPPPYGPRLQAGDATPMSLVNSIFRDYGHMYAYDYDEMCRLLFRFPFSSVDRVNFMEGRNQRLLIDTAGRQPESLYVEALK